MTLEHSFPDAAIDPTDPAAAIDGLGDVATLHSHAVDLTVPGETRLPTARLELSIHDAPAPESGTDGDPVRLVTNELMDAVARGQVLAVMNGDASAYAPRLGFGLAADAASVTLDPAVAGSVRRPAPGTIETVTGVAGLDRIMEVHDRCARGRVGTLGRSTEMWASLFAVANDADADATAVAFHLDSTGLAGGYVRYEVGGGAESIGTVHELWGEQAATERALWEHVLGLDGVARWHAPRRPVDESLRHALADTRGYTVTGRHDDLWVRIVDVDVALGARSYNPGARAVTIRVVDPTISANNGTWRIDAYGSFRNQAEPDVEMTVDQLSAVYLGGTSVRELRDADRVVARTADAAADADVLFASHPRPFCGF